MKKCSSNAVEHLLQKQINTERDKKEICCEGIEDMYEREYLCERALNLDSLLTSITLTENKLQGADCMRECKDYHVT